MGLLVFPCVLVYACQLQEKSLETFPILIAIPNACKEVCAAHQSITQLTTISK
jgi:hypothetical protein